MLGLSGIRGLVFRSSFVSLTELSQRVDQCCTGCFVEMSPVGPCEVPAAAESAVFGDIGNGVKRMLLPGLRRSQQGVNLLQANGA